MEFEITFLFNILIKTGLSKDESLYSRAHTVPGYTRYVRSRFRLARPKCTRGLVTLTITRVVKRGSDLRPARDKPFGEFRVDVSARV